MKQMVERVESIKAGAIAGFSVILADGIITLGNTVILASELNAQGNIWDIRHLAIAGAIAGISGFLFGVTYRYIIREDSNPHLKSGAVLAFGLVRGLAQLDAGLSLSAGNIFSVQSIWPFGVLAIESIALFAVAQIILDWAISRHWLKPFHSN